MPADRNVVAVCVFYASLYFVIVSRVNADSEKGHASTCMQNISIGINIVKCKNNETETANPEKPPTSGHHSAPPDTSEKSFNYVTPLAVGGCVLSVVPFAISLGILMFRKREGRNARDEVADV